MYTWEDNPQGPSRLLFREAYILGSEAGSNLWPKLKALPFFQTERASGSNHHTRRWFVLPVQLVELLGQQITLLGGISEA